MATATLDSRSNKGWVKLLIESVDVELDSEEAVLLSTVQSLIPGAHGLYYRDNGVRKALSLDTTTGRVLSPSDGWRAQDIFVHIAHGHRHGVNCGMGGEYTKASEIFERNVSAVQKLIASAGLGYGGLRRSDAKNSPKRSSRMKSGFEAQPEEVHISDESDSFLQQKLDQKQKEVDTLTTEKEDLVLRLKEVEGELDTQKKENDQLRNTLNDALSQAAPEIISESPQATSSTDKKKKGKKGKNDDPKDALIQQLQRNLEDAVQRNNELSEQMATSSQERPLDESGFVDHGSDSEERVERQATTDKLQGELDEANKKIQELIEKEEEMNNLHNLIEELRGRLVALQKEKNEAEGHLAEHKEWLKNAQEKVSCLEQHASGAKSEEVKELENEKARQSETIWLAHEKIGQLEQTVTSLQLRLTDANEMLGQTLHKDELIAKMNEEKDKLQWKIGELTQWWNDAKWKIGELEASFVQQQADLDAANEKLMKMLEETRNITPSGIHEAIAQPGSRTTYTVQKQPHSDRWQLASHIGAESVQQPPAFYPGYAPVAFPSYQPFPYAYPPYGFPAYPSAPAPAPTDNRRVLFEVDTPDAKTVFLAGSFLNWEVALLCRPLGNGRHGVWVDIPKGTHEFKFLVDGEWRSSQCYPIAGNEFGSLNNSRVVE